jgi:hypothetical protein
MHFYRLYLIRSKKPVQVRGPEELIIPPAQHPSLSITLVSCPWEHVPFIHNSPPYLEAFSSIRNLTTRHAVVTRDSLNMEFKLFEIIFKFQYYIQNTIQNCTNDPTYFNTGNFELGAVILKMFSAEPMWHFSHTHAPFCLLDRVDDSFLNRYLKIIVSRE